MTAGDNRERRTRASHATGTLLVASLILSFPVLARAGDITLTDQRDKVIVLPHPAQRVVVIPKPIATMVIAVDGGTRHLVGINPASRGVIMKSVLGTVFPEIARMNTNIVGEGFRPNVEELLKINPDVVIQWALKIEDYIEPMERVGLTVVGLGYGTNEIERGRITIIGAMLGQQERAKSFLDWQDEVRGAIKTRLSGLPPDRRSRAVFFDRFRHDGKSVFGRDEFFFQAAGVRNVAFESGLNQANATVDDEQLLAWDPDIIFLNYYDETSKPQDLYDDPVLANLSAVKSRRVYKTPRLDPASQEAPLVWTWMTMLAYPALYNQDGSDLRRDIQEKYLAFYGKVTSREDIDDIIQMGANGESNYYHKMFDK